MGTSTIHLFCVWILLAFVPTMLSKGKIDGHFVEGDKVKIKEIEKIEIGEDDFDVEDEQEEDSVHNNEDANDEKEEDNVDDDANDKLEEDIVNDDADDKLEEDNVDNEDDSDDEKEGYNVDDDANDRLEKDIVDDDANDKLEEDNVDNKDDSDDEKEEYNVDDDANDKLEEDNVDNNDDSNDEEEEEFIRDKNGRIIDKEAYEGMQGVYEDERKKLSKEGVGGKIAESKEAKMPKSSTKRTFKKRRKIVAPSEELELEKDNLHVATPAGVLSNGNQDQNVAQTTQGITGNSADPTLFGSAIENPIEIPEISEKNQTFHFYIHYTYKNNFHVFFLVSGTLVAVIAVFVIRKKCKHKDNTNELVVAVYAPNNNQPAYQDNPPAYPGNTSASEEYLLTPQEDDTASQEYQPKTTEDKQASEGNPLENKQIVVMY